MPTGDRPLYETIGDGFPTVTVEPLHRGTPDPRSAVITHRGAEIVITDDGLRDGERLWLVGLYTVDDWTEGAQPRLFVTLGDSEILGYIAELLTMQPEGTDFLAWSIQWTNDAIADERLFAESDSPT